MGIHKSRPVAKTEAPPKRDSRYMDSFEMYRRFVDNISDMIFETNESAVFTFANKRANEILGYEIEEIMGKTPLDLMEPGFAAAITEEYTKVLNAAESFPTFEAPYVRKNGSIVWLETSGSTVFQDDVFKGYDIISRDISHRRIMSEEIIKNEERWRFALEGSGNGVWDLWIKIEYIYLSDNLLNILGYTRDECPSNPLQAASLFHPDDFGKLLAVANRHFDGECEFFECEMRIMRSDKRYRWYLVRGKVITRDGDNLPLRMIGTITDISTIKKLEEELLNFKFIIENADEEFCISRTDGYITYANKYAAKSLCYTREEIIGMHMRQFDPQYDEISEKISDMIKTGHMHPFETTHMTKNGDSQKKIISVIPMHIDEEVHICMFARDITEKETMLNELRQSEEKYRLLISKLPDIVVIHNHGKIFFANDAMKHITGYGYDEIYEHQFYELMDEPSIDGLKGHIKKIETNLPAPEFIEIKISTKEKGWRHVEIRSSYINYGSQRMLMSVLTDITDRRNFERNLLEEKERLSVTLKNISDGVITIDAHARITLMNNSAENITGCSYIDSFGMDLDSVYIFLKNDRVTPAENSALTVLNRKFVSYLNNSGYLKTKNGRIISAEESASPIFAADGSISGVVLIFRDVTEKKNIEEQRMRSQKLESVGLLAGGIAHDFNNILTSILGNISLARLESNSPATENRLSQAEKATMRAKDLTQQLLTLSKGGMPIRTTASIKELVRDASELTLHGSEITCDFNIAADIYNLSIDTGQISQVLHNIFINARQAMAGSGKISLTCVNHYEMGVGKFVKILISDTGCGIPHDELGRIFDPYFTTKSEGHGLGLATSYSIIHKHGGRISADSVVGKGTTITLYLPAIDAAPAKKADTEFLPLNKPLKLLVLEDDESIVSLLTMIFNKEKYESVFTNNGHDTIDKYIKSLREKAPFDIILLDLTVPGGLGGQDTMNELIKINPRVKAIVSSGYSNDDVLANYAKYGFRNIIVKPYRVEELLRVIAETHQLDSQ